MRKSIIIILCGILSCGCANVKKTVYFADVPNSANIAKVPIPETRIEPHDLLSITVSSMNPAATTIFNTPNSSYVTSTTATGTSLQSPGYLVNNAGYITFPVIGDVKVSGLTTDQLRKQLMKTLTDRQLLVDPVVSVRHLNFKVSVLGEVAHPTVINVPDEKISLLEALGLAGDITIYGRKDNVMLIRDENGVKKIKRFDLNSSELLTSPYYYLQSDDIVYVEANKDKVASTSRSAQVWPIVLSGLSFLAIIIDRLATK